MPFEQASLAYVEDRSALRGGVLYGKIGRIWKVARSLENFAYGGIRSGNRALSAVEGPLIPTFIIPQTAGFVNRHFTQKNNWWFSPPIISKVGKGVFVFVFLEKTAVFATITTGYIVRSFLRRVDTFLTFPVSSLHHQIPPPVRHCIHRGRASWGLRGRFPFPRSHPSSSTDIQHTAFTSPPR